MVNAPPLEELDIRAAVARDGDLSTYSGAMHDWEMEEYQEWWADALDHEDKILIICPPDTRKSSTVQCWIEKQIGLNPNIRILWLMKAGAQAQARVNAVAETIENNPVFHKAFPGVVPNKDAGWSKTSLYVRRTISGPDPTLMGCGFNGPYQGFHFDIIITDDPTNQQDVKSPATMESQRLLLRGVVMDRLVKTGRWVAIFTRWGEDDLVPTFKSLGFRIVVMPIISDKYPWGPTISNTRFPLEFCHELRVKKTPAIFDLTYMCDPQAVDGGIIRRESLRYWSSKPQGPNYVPLPERATVAIMACDLAASKNNWADPSCIGTALVELVPPPGRRRVYITDLWAKRVEAMDFEDEIVKRAKQTAKLSWIGVETIGYQLSFLQRMKRTYSLPFRELPYRTKRNEATSAKGLDKTKEGRAVSIAQMFGEGRLYLPENAGLVDGVSLESELCSFPFGAHDDRLDVIAFLCAMADTYNGPKIPIRMIRG